MLPQMVKSLLFPILDKKGILMCCLLYSFQMKMLLWFYSFIAEELNGILGNDSSINLVLSVSSKFLTRRTFRQLLRCIKSSQVDTTGQIICYWKRNVENLYRRHLITVYCFYKDISRCRKLKSKLPLFVHIC